jgi:hypothetical protein
MPREGLPDARLHRAVEIATAAAGNDGQAALNHPEDVAKLISVIARQLYTLANEPVTE